MFVRPPHLVRQAARLVAAFSVVGILTGCQAVVTSKPLSQIRVIDASPDAPGLDIYEGNAALTYNLGFGTVTSYIPISTGIYTFAADSARTKQALTSSEATLTANGQYTILIGDVAASLQQQILTDQNLPAPSGQIALRFIDQATHFGAVDIYLLPVNQILTAVTPIAAGVVFGANTGYLTVPSGTYTVVLLPAGTVPTIATVPTYSGTQVKYSAGAARTIVLIDQQLLTTPGLQVITADDYDSPSATS